jgi:hypothetical protein
MEKRGQVTVFIILAIIFIVGIGVFFFVRSDISIGGEKVNPDVQPIYSSVENCLKEVGEDAIEYVGQTGGYFTLPELSTETSIAYYVYENKNLMPSKEEVEEEISTYVDAMLYFCNNEFSNFPDFEVEVGDIKTSAKIKEGKVVFNSKIPLSISKGDKTYTFDDFKNIEVASRLNTIYEMADDITEEEMSSEGTCISCLIDWALEKDLFVEMNDYDEGVIIFTLRDESVQINNNDYRFYFANKKS